MKVASQKKIEFWKSLDRYVISRIFDVSWKWEWVGVGLVGLVIAVSMGNGYITSPTLTGNSLSVMREAASNGDYALADKLYQMNGEDRTTNSVLGANLELEELVYPERKLEREIERQEELLTRYPGSRDIILTLAELYKQSKNNEKYLEYYEMARSLDPNGVLIQEI